MKTTIAVILAGLAWIAATPAFEHAKHSARVIAILAVVAVPIVVWRGLHFLVSRSRQKTAQRPRYSYATPTRRRSR